MNSSYLNMAAGSFLGTVFIVMSVSLLSDGLFHTEAPEQEGFAIEVVEAAPAGGGEEEAATPIAVLLESADPAAGEASFRKCAACHTAEEGGPNRVGPNLWDVVNRPVASHEGFSYSDAMVAFSEGGEVVWDYDHLAGFLASPRTYVEGTAMSFAGLTREDELANVIAYLRTLSAEPAPLPEPEAAAAPEEAGEAAAEGEATEGETPAEGEAAEGEAIEGEEATDENTAPAQAPRETGSETIEQPAPVDDTEGDEPVPAGEVVPEDGEAATADEEAAPVEEELEPAE